jgi:hypothetical protein
LLLPIQQLGKKMIIGYAIERLGSVELSLLFEMLVPRRGRCSEGGAPARGKNRFPVLVRRTGAPPPGPVAVLPG